MAGNDKQWAKPELIVLVRSKPEEAVLTFCKSSWGAGPSGANRSCQYYSGGCGVCSSGSSS